MQVKLLCDVGVTAVHAVVSTDFYAVVMGQYRFGMKYNGCMSVILYTIWRTACPDKFPIIALMATAPSHVKDAICSSLGLEKPAVVLQTLDRPNIYFHMQEQGFKRKFIGSLNSGIIFVLLV